MSRACLELGCRYRLATTRDDEARENGTIVLEASFARGRPHGRGSARISKAVEAVSAEDLID